ARQARVGTRRPGTNSAPAVGTLEPIVPPTTEEGKAEHDAAGLAKGKRMLHGFGITLVQDANVNRRLLEAYHAAATSGVLTMKVVAAQATDPRKPVSQVDELIALRESSSAGHLT